MSDTEQRIREQIESNPILLYMKGSPDMPRCGFSAKAVELLRNCGANFSHVDVLENPDIRQTLPTVANWPTYPQLWVNGELIGGCDIMIDHHESGALKEIVATATA